MDMQALRQIGIDHPWQVPLCCPIKIFGDSRELQQTINQIGMTYYFQGISFASGKYLNLRAAKYIEAEEVGKLSVVYKGKRGVLSSSRLKVFFLKKKIYWQAS